MILSQTMIDAARRMIRLTSMNNLTTHTCTCETQHTGGRRR